MTQGNTEIDGGQTLRISIVAGKFNLEITQRLIDGAKSYLESQGVASDSINTFAASVIAVDIDYNYPMML